MGKHDAHGYKWDRRNRILSCACLLLAVLMLTACAAAPDTQEDDALQLSLQDTTPGVPPGASPDTSGDTATVPEAMTLSPAPGGDGRLSVSGAVAYAFDGLLYGGFAYTNAGTSPAALTEAALTFTLPGGQRTETYTAFHGVNDVVLPGATAYATLFLPVEGLEAAPASLEVALSQEQSSDEYVPLDVSDARLIQNYPGFATLSGHLTNSGGETVSLCFVYVSFYDADDTLIGVWYFPHNTVLQPGQGAPFVRHMRSLPIENLAERTANMHFRAFGVD